MTYQRQDFATAAIAAGLMVRADGDKLLVFTDRGQPLFSSFRGDFFDPNGMLFSDENVIDATAAERALFPNEGSQ